MPCSQAEVFESAKPKPTPTSHAATYPRNTSMTSRRRGWRAPAVAWSACSAVSVSKPALHFLHHGARLDRLREIRGEANLRRTLTVIRQRVSRQRDDRRRAGRGLLAKDARCLP